jgi:hypothetical protein
MRIRGHASIGVPMNVSMNVPVNVAMDAPTRLRHHFGHSEAIKAAISA